MANELTFNQVSTILNSVVSQATGKTTIAPVNTNEFVSVGQMALKTGYDPVLNAISQVLSKTIFSVRPYERKFGGIEVSNQRYGNITRKLSISDKPFVDDDRMTLEEGESKDMYEVNKANILQVNFYGANTYQKAITIFRDQLDCAFNSPEEFSQFIAMVTGNATDMLEQARENLARNTIANFIGGKSLGDTGSVIHLLTEYNAVTGLELDIQTLYKPENYKSFIQWAYSRIQEISSLMTERSLKYHINITGKEVARHTPLLKQKCYINGANKFQIDNMALSNVFHKDLMKLNCEVINFWQSIDSPTTINNKPVYLKPDGTLTSPESATTINKVFGVLFDEDALGYTLVNQWSSPTPFNARGGYSNIFWHETCKYWNDFTENGVIFLLD